MATNNSVLQFHFLLDLNYFSFSISLLFCVRVSLRISIGWLFDYDFIRLFVQFIFVVVLVKLVCRPDNNNDTGTQEQKKILFLTTHCQLIAKNINISVDRYFCFCIVVVAAAVVAQIPIFQHKIQKKKFNWNIHIHKCRTEWQEYEIPTCNRYRQCIWCIMYNACYVSVNWINNKRKQNRNMENCKKFKWNEFVTLSLICHMMNGFFRHIFFIIIFISSLFFLIKTCTHHITT